LFCIAEFYVLLTMHLGIILVNKQLDAQFFFLYVISILYMFWATSCSSSGDSVVSIQHLVCVTLCRWPSIVQVRKEVWSWLNLVLLICTKIYHVNFIFVVILQFFVLFCQKSFFQCVLSTVFYIMAADWYILLEQNCHIFDKKIM
jgi:hypothetical protein